ncbi:MAG: hypothetical protein V2I36_19560 [Desulfopila sp.]|jgi:hypothetical protein|nr:hypothetical protein [Desulfopila sp.]
MQEKHHAGEKLAGADCPHKGFCQSLDDMAASAAITGSLLLAGFSPPLSPMEKSSSYSPIKTPPKQPLKPDVGPLYLHNCSFLI